MNARHPFRRAAPVLLALTLLAAPADARAERIELYEDLEESGEIYLEQQDGGGLRYVLVMPDGSEQAITPEEFTKRLYSQRIDRSWWRVLLNITSSVGVWWVALGLLGQVLFTGRMIVQWIVSEKEHRSVIPPAFWWMSLVGASMLMTYFIWRKDIVGFIGQATGWLIYVRNIYFIYRPGGEPTQTDDAHGLSDD